MAVMCKQLNDVIIVNDIIVISGLLVAVDEVKPLLIDGGKWPIMCLKRE